MLKIVLQLQILQLTHRFSTYEKNTTAEFVLFFNFLDGFPLFFAQVERRHQGRRGRQQGGGKERARAGEQANADYRA